MITEQQTLQPTRRFSNRADNYLQYRPAYPADIVDWLEQTTSLQTANRVADIGCGTGHFAKLFLKKGYNVTGIEPNVDMREAAEKLLEGYQHFSCLASRAEVTELPNHSIDMVTVAQAFHWMDPGLTRLEFQRILKPGHPVVIASNARKNSSPFLQGYDQLKHEFRMESTPVVPDEERVQNFFQRNDIPVKKFSHQHWLDFDGLKGLLLSSSAIPLPGHRRYDTMIAGLVPLFVAYNKNGFVEMEYETTVYVSTFH